jgi:electron transfer flavoprotein beta subunit
VALGRTSDAVPHLRRLVALEGDTALARLRQARELLGLALPYTAPDGYDVIEVSLPALITVSNEIGTPRYPTMKGIMAAKRKEPIVWKPADIGADPARLGVAGRRAKLVKLFQPVRESKVEIIGGETPEEAGTNLALKLREIKVL